MKDEMIRERITTYMDRLEKADAMNEMVPSYTKGDRRKRKMINTFSNLPGFRECYQQMIAEGAIHEEGSGKPGDPVIIKTGPAPKPASELPLMFTHIDKEDLQRFMARVVLQYDAQGWPMTETTIKDEIRKAFESYQIGRPY